MTDDTFAMRCCNKGYKAYYFSEPVDIDCDTIIKNLAPSELKAYVDINQKIDLQNHYCTVTANGNRKKQTLLVWYNGSKKWNAVHPDAQWWEGKDETELRLGPNMILAEYPYRTVNKFAECLKTHPLYHCSFEAKKRGEVDSLDATLCWALKQIERIKNEEWQEKNK
jgi:hypothetical protein